MGGYITIGVNSSVRTQTSNAHRMQTHVMHNDIEHNNICDSSFSV